MKTHTEKITEALEAVRLLNESLYNPVEGRFSLTTDGEFYKIHWDGIQLCDSDEEIRRYIGTTFEYEPYVDAIINKMVRLNDEISSVVNVIKKY